MNQQQHQQQSSTIENLLNQLYQQISKPQDIHKLAPQLKELFRRLDEAWQKAIDLLDIALQVAESSGDKDFQDQVRQIQQERKPEMVSVLAEQLREKGFTAPREVKEGMENSLYRLMELTRLGKREEVFYGILRVFVARGKPFPKDLARAFKPIYDHADFATLVLSYLTGVQQALYSGSGQSSGQSENSEAQ